MNWHKRLLGGVLISAVALAACGGGGEDNDDSQRDSNTTLQPAPESPSSPEDPSSPSATQESCTWTLTRAGSTVTGQCLGALGYDPARPLSSLAFESSAPSVITVSLVLPEVLAPGSYSFGNSSLTGSVTVTDSTGLYYAIRGTGATIQGSATYDVLRVDNTSVGTFLQGRIQVEALRVPFFQSSAQLTIDFSGLLR